MLIDWDKLPGAQGMRPGSERRAISGEKISAVLITTAPDAVFDGKPHWHENEQILVMVSGLCRLTIDGAIVEARAGDMVFFPTGSRHCAVGTGPEGCSYYEIFAPARADQMPGWVGRSALRFD